MGGKFGCIISSGNETIIIRKGVNNSLKERCEGKDKSGKNKGFSESGKNKRSPGYANDQLGENVYNEFSTEFKNTGMENSGMKNTRVKINEKNGRQGR